MRVCAQVQALLDAEREAAAKAQRKFEETLSDHGLGQEALEARLEAEREKRVAHIQQIAVRRIGQMNLARGWSAWHEQWEIRAGQQRLLRSAGARLMRPKLAAAVTHWRRDWDESVLEAQRSAATLSFSEQLAGQRSSLSSELQQVSTPRCGVCVCAWRQACDAGATFSAAVARVSHVSRV